MKNKKGITLGRIILYILFAFVIVFIIWSLVLTYRSIKNPNSTTKIECDNESSLRMIQPNGVDFRNVNLFNPDDYHFSNVGYDGNNSSEYLSTGANIHLAAASYSISFVDLSTDLVFRVRACSTYGYNVTDYYYDSGWVVSSSKVFTLEQSGYLCIILGARYGGNVTPSMLDNTSIMLNYGSTVASFLPYEDYHYLNATNYITGSSSYGSNSWYIPGSSSVGALDYVTDIYNYYTSDTSHSWVPFYGSNLDYNYYIINNTLIAGGSMNDIIYYLKYNQTTGSYQVPLTQSINVLNVVFDCDNLPINLFNFSLTGDTLNYSTEILLYFELPNVNDSVYYVNFDSSQKFTSSIITNSMPYVTSLKRFGFLIYLQNDSSITNSSSSYIPSSWLDYSIVYQPNLLNRLIDIDLVFDAIMYTPEEQAIYDSGYYDGVRSADTGLANQITSLNNTIDTLTQTISDMNTRINSQTQIIDTLQNQINLADNNFKSLFFTFADVPFRTVSNALGFEFFGVNLFRFFVGIITALGLIWLIKKLI